MSRRQVLLVMCLLAAPLVALAQPAKVYRIGVLTSTAPAATYRTLPNYQVFFESLRQHGYVEGQNFEIEYRTAEGKFDRLPALAAELAASKLDVILVATCGAPLDAARRATSAIPIVVAACTGDRSRPESSKASHVPEATSPACKNSTRNWRLNALNF